MEQEVNGISLKKRWLISLSRKLVTRRWLPVPFLRRLLRGSDTNSRFVLLRKRSEQRTNRLLLPSHLVDQWRSEIDKFLPDLKDNVIVLGSGKASHIAKLTIRQVLKAKVIIVAWNRFAELTIREVLKAKIIVVAWDNFAELTIREVLKPKIIMVAWDNCTKPPYLKMVANLAGLVKPAVNWFSPPFTFITRPGLTFNLEDRRLVPLFP